MTTVDTKEDEEKLLLLILGRVSDLNTLLTLTLLNYKAGEKVRFTLLTLTFASTNSWFAAY